VRRFGLAGIIALAALLAVPQVASADGHVTSTNYGATVFFFSYGEHFEVWDVAPDGHSAVGKIDVFRNREWSRVENVWNSKGYGSNGTKVERNYSFPEGTRVRYQACVGESGSGSIFYCSDWHYDTA
jgi:hypothetical protein